MAHAPIRLLYLGRHTPLAQEIDSALLTLRSEHRDLFSHPVRVARVRSQQLALDHLRSQPCHALLLDIGSGRRDRVRFCEGLRRRYPALCIVATSLQPLGKCRFKFDAKIQLPICLKDAEGLLRKLNRNISESELQFGHIYLNMATRTLRGPLGSHLLPPKQCALLQILLQNGADIVSRETIMRAVWETEYVADTRTLDVHMRWLREKIEPDPSHPVYLLTVRGQGYRLATNPAD